MKKAGTEIALTNNIINNEEELSKEMIKRYSEYDEPPLMAPEFSKISSIFLINMNKDMEFEIHIDETTHKSSIKPINEEIKINKPNKNDLKWAKSLEKMTTKDRELQLLKALKKNNNWQVAYMCKKFAEQDRNLQWFNPNREFIYFMDSNTSSICAASHSGSLDLLLLLLNLGSSISIRGEGDYEFSSSLKAASLNKNKDTAIKMLEILTCFKDHDNHDVISTMGSAPLKTMRDILQEYHDKINNVERKKKAPLKKLEKQNSKEINSDGMLWEKLDDYTISRTTTCNTEFRLRRIFNFLGSTVSETSEYLKDGEVYMVSKPDTQPMAKGSSNREIKQAQEKLKLMRP